MYKRQVAFIYGSQSIESQAKMVKHVKKHKAGFIISDSNVKSGTPLKDVIELVKETGHSTVMITEDGTANAKFLGFLIFLQILGSETKISSLVPVSYTHLTPHAMEYNKLTLPCIFRKSLE